MSAALLGASVDDTVYWKWYFASASSACVGHSCRKTSSTPTEHGFWSDMVQHCTKCTRTDPRTDRRCANSPQTVGE